MMPIIMVIITHERSERNHTTERKLDALLEMIKIRKNRNGNTSLRKLIHSENA